jgi:uncharacterized protein YcfJ
MNTRKPLILLAAAFCGANSSYAVNDFVDTAQVISSSPIIERVSEPRQECSNEAVSAPKERSIVGPIIGGIAGALIGRQVGHGNGRDIATAVGAAAGTMAGDAVANPDANRNYTGAAVGAVAGGVLGNQVGNGRGNGAATAAGTIAGTMVGDRAGARTTASAQSGQRCRTVESTREVVKGYNVVYRYNGRDVSATLPYNPGNTVRVGVGIIDDPAPAAEREYRRDRNSSNDDTRAPANPNYSYRY